MCISLRVVIHLFKIHIKRQRKKDNSIRLADVKAWFDANIQRTTQLRGYNSYVAPKANFEYEVELFFITKPEDLEYKIGMVVIDVFF